MKRVIRLLTVCRPCRHEYHRQCIGHFCLCGCEVSRG